MLPEYEWDDLVGTQPVSARFVEVEVEDLDLAERSNWGSCTPPKKKMRPSFHFKT